jgi:hypothetical protein
MHDDWSPVKPTVRKPERHGVGDSLPANRHRFIWFDIATLAELTAPP